MKRNLLFALVGALVALLVAVSVPSLVDADDQLDPNPRAVTPPGDARAVTTSSELLYVPVDSCRVVDTRAGGGKLTKGVPRGFDVVGRTTNHSAQGGSATGCDVAASAVAVNLTATSVGAEGRGSVRLWPSDKPIPLGPSLTFTDAILASTTGAVPVCETGCGGDDLKMQATGNATHLTIDVTGYWVEPLWAHVSSTGTLLGGTSRAVTASTTGGPAGAYEIEFDRNIADCSFTVAPDSEVLMVRAEPRFDNVNAAFAQFRDQDGTATNTAFYIQVIC